MNDCAAAALPRYCRKTTSRAPWRFARSDQTLYPNSPYGYPVLGTEASNKAITREDMLAFWKQGYVPSNSILAVAGDFHETQLTELRQQIFWQMVRPRVHYQSSRDSCRAYACHIDCRQAGRATNISRACRSWAPAGHSGLRAAGSDEHRAGRTILQPHQHESPRRAWLHIRSIFFIPIPSRRRTFSSAARFEPMQPHPPPEKCSRK